MTCPKSALFTEPEFRRFVHYRRMALIPVSMRSRGGSTGPRGTRSGCRARTRRARMLLFAAVAFLAGPTLVDAGPESSAEKPFFFIQMADTQFGMFATPLLFSYLGLPWNDDEFEEESRLFEKAIAAANRLKPAFVVICGDLVNRPGHAGQAAEFNRISRELDPGIPLHLVAGNHDIGNKPTHESLEWYRSTFGSDRYSFRHGDVYGIVVNSAIIHQPDRVPAEAAEQRRWLESELEEARTRGVAHLLIFQHHPLFLEAQDEDNDYFNIPRERRQIYLDLFREYGVRAIFAGHYHRNSTGRDGTLEMITTGPVGRPLGDGASGFRVVRILGDRIEHDYHALDPLPESVPETPIPPSD